MAKQEIYVIDTNILIDYPNIIDDGGDAPAEPTIDLRAAHLVIPAVVIQELSSFKREKTDRGKVARAVLRRLRALTEGHPVSINDACGLRAPIKVGCGQQLLSILPVCVFNFLLIEKISIGIELLYSFLIINSFLIDEFSNSSFLLVLNILFSFVSSKSFITSKS